MTTDAPKTYRVADRGMPADVRMIASGNREWFAGDAITTKDLPAAVFADYLATGVIEEVADVED